MIILRIWGKGNQYSLYYDLSKWTHTYKINHKYVSKIILIYIVISILSIVNEQFGSPNTTNVLMKNYIEKLELIIYTTPLLIELVILYLVIYSMYVNMNKYNFTPVLMLYILVWLFIIYMKTYNGFYIKKNTISYTSYHQSYSNSYWNDNNKVRLLDGIVFILCLTHIYMYNKHNYRRY